MGAMGAVLGVVGGIVQGVGAMQAHKAEAAAHEYNAAVALRNRDIIHQQTAATIADQQEADVREMASIRGMFANMGLSYTGSATDLTRDALAAKYLGVQRISYRGTLAEIEQTDKYNSEKMGANAERDAAPISMIAGILSGVSSGIDSYSRMT